MTASPSAASRIYLDHNATTPLRPAVRAAFVAALDVWGNASSVHSDGRAAREVVERARRQVAALVGATAEEIVFTSGGTEADHLGIRGLALAARQARGLSRGHVISSPLEHPAVLNAVDELKREGFDVTLLPVSARGEIALEDLRAALRDDTVLVSLALANHELGNLYAVQALAGVARKRGALVHTDAVQAAGRVAIDVGALGVDALSLSAHKLYGPKGVGALYVRRGVDLHPLVGGGHQERERRGGTENVPGVVGFGEAAQLIAGDLDQVAARVAALRDRLETRLLAIPGARRHGADDRVPGTCNLAFDGAEGQLVMVGLDLEGVSVSTGAACTSGSVEPSPVLLGLGLPPEKAREGVRFSLGRDTTEHDVDRAARLTEVVVQRVRAAGHRRPSLV